jgi:hypothetical protein
MLRAQAGNARQITQVRKPDPQVPFEVRIVAVNDRVWTGKGVETKVRFPALDSIPLREDWPDENMCSIAIRVRYGRFDYFTGGDMPGYPVPGAAAWHDEETDVARAIGPTDVHVVNHHGSLEEENPFWLATLGSRVMIVPAWGATLIPHRMSSSECCHLASMPGGATSSQRCSGTQPRPQPAHARRRLLPITGISSFEWKAREHGIGCWSWMIRPRAIALLRSMGLMLRSDRLPFVFTPAQPAREDS